MCERKGAEQLILLTMNWGVTKSQVCVLPPQLNAICLRFTIVEMVNGTNGSGEGIMK